MKMDASAHAFLTRFVGKDRLHAMDQLKATCPEPGVAFVPAAARP